MLDCIMAHGHSALHQHIDYIVKQKWVITFQTSITIPEVRDKHFSATEPLKPHADGEAQTYQNSFNPCAPNSPTLNIQANVPCEVPPWLLLEVVGRSKKLCNQIELKLLFRSLLEEHVKDNINVYTDGWKTMSVCRPSAYHCPRRRVQYTVMLTLM